MFLRQFGNLQGLKDWKDGTSLGWQLPCSSRVGLKLCRRLRPQRRQKCVFYFCANCSFIAAFICSGVGSDL
jgi:hypothetical protein